MSNTFLPVESLRTPERRSHPRQKVLFSCAELSDGNGGTVLNITERGLALQTVRSLSDKRLRRVRFQFSRSQAWVETQGRIAWIDASKSTAGLEFVNLPDEARNRITHWISLVFRSNQHVEPNEPVEKVKVVETEVPARNGLESVLPILQYPTKERLAENRSGHLIVGNAIEDATHSTIALPGRPSAKPRANPQIGVRGRSIATDKPNRSIGLAVSMILLLSAVLAFGYPLGRASNRGHNIQGTAGVIASPFSKESFTKPENSDVGATRPLDVREGEGTGFVLQVGAMIHKDTADRLAKSLREKHFPASVSHTGTDPFYRVVVGPYHDVGAASKVREELIRQDVDPILRRWNPQL
jgi:SPOR domain/PilZ domain